MNRNIINTSLKTISVLIVVIALIFSCSSPIDDGFYKLSERIVYFPSDSMQTLSFGTRFSDNATLNIPIKITGTTPSKNLKVNVKVVEALTSAKLNENYRPISQTIEIPKGSFDGVIPIELLRGTLSSTSLEKVRLVVELQNSDDLKAELYDKKRVYIDIDNYLEEPYWWSMGWGNSFGKYHPVKFRKMLEDFNNSVPEFENALINNYYYVLIQFTKVYDFFKANPQYGDVYLPEKIYRPYVPKNNTTSN